MKRWISTALALALTPAWLLGSSAQAQAPARHQPQGTPAAVAFVTDIFGSRVGAINIRTGKVTFPVKSAVFPDSLVFLDSQTLILSSPTGALMSANVSTGKVTTLASGGILNGASDMALIPAPPGKQISDVLIARRGGTGIADYNFKTKKVSYFSKTFVDPNGMAFDREGELFVNSQKNHGIFQLDPKTGAIINKWIIGKSNNDEPDGMSWDPTSDDIFSAAGSNIYRLTVKTKKLSVFTNGFLVVDGLAIDQNSTIFACDPVSGLVEVPMNNPIKGRKVVAPPPPTGFWDDIAPLTPATMPQ